MPARVSESIVLRTYPLGEADLIVSFLAREQGKLRGVAKRARRPRSVFGSGLERLSLVRMFYFQRETRELVNLDSCELIRSRFGMSSDYAAGVVMDYLAEVTDELLPAAEPGERHFRLLLAVLDYMQAELAAGRGQAIWPAALYFSLWAVKLAGFLPALRVSPESGSIAEEMLVTPIAQLGAREWRRQSAADLRRALVRVIEEHIEKNLVTPPLVEAL